jgi:hypothetical protein
MKGTPALPGGSLKSKPTWGSISKLFPHVGFCIRWRFSPCLALVRLGVGNNLCHERHVSRHKGNETMIHKKVEGKKPARTRRSLAALMLGDAVRATLPVPAAAEPWRNKKVKSKNRSRR